MHYVIDQTIINQHKTLLYCTVRKEFDFEGPILAGMGIEDPLSKDPNEVASVTVNPEEGYYYLVLKQRPEMSSDEECARVLELYESNGWSKL